VLISSCDRPICRRKLKSTRYILYCTLFISPTLASSTKRWPITTIPKIHKCNITTKTLFFSSKFSPSATSAFSWRCWPGIQSGTLLPSLEATISQKRYGQRKKKPHKARTGPTRDIQVDRRRPIKQQMAHLIVPTRCRAWQRNHQEK